MLRGDHSAGLFIERTANGELTVFDVGPLKSANLAGTKARLTRKQDDRAIAIIVACGDSALARNALTM
jgi:hypothetical protein